MAHGKVCCMSRVSLSHNVCMRVATDTRRPVCAIDACVQASTERRGIERGDNNEIRARNFIP